MTTKHIRMKLSAGLTALVLTASLTPVHAVVQVPVQSYQDVALDAWYAMPVEFCRQYALVEPAEAGRFDPASLLTRATLAEALYRLEGCPEPAEGLETPPEAENPPAEPEVENPPAEPEGEPETPPLDPPEALPDETLPENPPEETPPEEPPFSDVGLEHPNLSAVRWAVQTGVVHGYPDGTFRPQDPITREEIAVLLWNLQGQPEPAGAADYADLEAISDWAASAVAWAQGAGVMLGDTDNQFLPQDNTTRAQGATLIMRLGQTFHSLPEVTFPTRPEPDPNLYDNTLFSLDENGYLSYQGDIPSHRGIDVSSHQKEIDWTQVAGAGMEFAMIRAGYRGYTAGTLNKDAYFESNIQNALANGLEVGVYFFSQALTPQEAEEEAYLLLEWIEGYDVTYPVVFDWEEIDRSNSRSQGASGDTVTACAQAFCRVVADAGYIPMTYGSPSKIYGGGLKLAELADYPAFWLAHYTRNTAPTSFRYHYDMWQYSSSGRVPGIEGDVDLDICLTRWPS